MRCPCARQRQGHDHPLFRVMPEAKPLPPLEELQRLFDYDQETGELRWKIKRTGGTNAGDEAGYISNPGYRIISLKGRLCMAHRIAWTIANGTIPLELQVDHINGNKSDNRLVNLRLCNGSENCRNRPAPNRNKSGYKGVYWWKEKAAWRADIKVEGKHHYLGTFDTPELAHMAYCKAAAELHGEFARAA